MANVDIRLGYKNTAWFTANASLVLAEGQTVHLEQTGTYKIGDGSTVLSSLSFLGGGASTLQDAFDNGATIVTSVSQTSLILRCGSGSNGDSVFKTTNTLGERKVEITGDGKIIMLSVPTSASGLLPGTIWSDGGTLKIV